MIITVASGKGGTGKTTVATNLAVALHAEGKDVQYVDCDVEAPNGHIFMKPEITERVAVKLESPRVDAEKCTGCGQCGEVCQFSAIVCINKKVLTFLELCHACGACGLICPEKAITEALRDIGVVEIGDSNGVDFIHGKLNIGEPIAPKIISEIKKRIDPRKIVVMDSPPGSSCPAIEAMKDSDSVLLVAEPTPFGLNDLEITYEVVKELDTPCFLAINKADIGDDRVRKFAESKELPIVLEVPHDRRIAECYSGGGLIVDALPDYRERFLEAFEKIGLTGKGQEGVESCQKKSS
ncbi:MAG: P-loop NTPase [Planctomycetes bacterium]|nr:P-loop NTPase [Planctomycetota bacterium]